MPQRAELRCSGSVGTNGVDPAFLREIINDPAYPAGKYFDVANFHFYGSKADAKQKIDNVRAVLASTGTRAISSPIWITEVGYRSKIGLQRDSHHLGPDRWTGGVVAGYATVPAPGWSG